MQYNGNLVRATELLSVIAKPFLDTWRIKLCHCKTHGQAAKKLNPAECQAILSVGDGHCGNVYADLVKDSAGDYGTAVHASVEEWFKTGVVPEHPEPEITMWANKIVTLYKANDVKPYIILPEERLIDVPSNLTGSPDTVAMWRGRPEILDTKIKNSLDDFMPMQGCAYRYLLRRIKGVDIRYFRAIWCQKKNVGKQVKDVLFDLDEWTDDFAALVRIFNRANPSRKVTLHE
jgi:hypothetical protein